jgi:hypothetical protein
MKFNKIYNLLCEATFNIPLGNKRDIKKFKTKADKKEVESLLDYLKKINPIDAPLIGGNNGKFKIVRSYLPEKDKINKWIIDNISSIKSYVAGYGNGSFGKASNTDMKEQLVVLLWEMGIDDMIDSNTAPALFKEIIKNKKTPPDLKTYFETNDPTSKSTLDFINDKISVSIAMLGSYSPSNYICDQKYYLKKIKNLGSKVIGLSPDKWNPSDIFLISKKTSGAAIIGNMKKYIEKQEPIKDTMDKDITSSGLSSFFVNNWGDQGNIVGISLKQEKAQAGKAKSYLKTFDNLKEFNLNKNEIGQPDDFYKKRIEIIQKKTEKYCSTFSDIMDSYSPSEKNVKSWQKTYASYKLLNFIIEQKDPTWWEALVLFGASIGTYGKYPPFFKITGSKKSEATVYPTIGAKYVKQVGKVEIIDTVQFMGVEVILTLEIESKENTQTKTSVLSIRPNGGTQSTIENKKF